MCVTGNQELTEWGDVTGPIEAQNKPNRLVLVMVSSSVHGADSRSRVHNLFSVFGLWILRWPDKTFDVCSCVTKRFFFQWRDRDRLPRRFAIFSVYSSAVMRACAHSREHAYDWPSMSVCNLSTPARVLASSIMITLKGAAPLSVDADNSS